MATKLYVGNISFGTTSDDLVKLFSQYGQVASAQVVMDRETGRSRGFAFVEMADGAEAAIQAFRLAYGDLLNVSPNGIVYGRSATQITYDFSRHLSRDWGEGDEVVVSQLDHDANVRPWIQAAERVGATVRWLRLEPATADLDLDDLADAVTERCRLVAVTGASNLLGTRPQVARISARAHEVGALVYVDGVPQEAPSELPEETPALAS